MNAEIGRNSKVLVMVSDGSLFVRIRTELEKYNVCVEESLFMLSYCRFVILDHFHYQWGVAEALTEKGNEKPVLLVLTRQQLHDGNIQLSGRIHEILLVPDRGEDIFGDLVCLRREEMPIQCVFENYLAESSEVALVPRGEFIYSERN